jgi:hypothetical protein
VGKPHEALGGLLKNKGGGGEKEEGEKDEGENEQLRLRLDLNLDIEVQLKAKIHGDLTLGLLYVSRRSGSANANILRQELVVDLQKLFLHSICNVNSFPPDRESHVLGGDWSCFTCFVRAAQRLCHGVDVTLHLSWTARSVPVVVCNKIYHDQ